MFQIWLECLYKFSFMFQILTNILCIICLPVLECLYTIICALFEIPGYFYNGTFMNFIVSILYPEENNINFQENYLKHQNILQVIQHQSDEFSDEFKDLVFRMLSYNFLDRPSLAQIKKHPWLKGPTPSQVEVKQAMSRLKSKFIQKEVEQHSTA